MSSGGDDGVHETSEKEVNLIRKSEKTDGEDQCKADEKVW